MDTLGWLIGQILWFVWAIIFWLLSTLFWFSVWVLLPIAIIAFIALRSAEYLIGKEAVRRRLKTHSLKFGRATWTTLHRALFALGALPLRVLAWLILYTFLHILISIIWTPAWSPWQRAWSRRWRRRPPVPQKERNR